MSKVKDHEHYDEIHDYMLWKEELERLLNDEKQDEKAIFEAKEMVSKYEEAFLGNEVLEK